MSLSLAEKLELFDANAPQAVAELIEWLTTHADELIALARARHISGHELYGDLGLFEHDVDGLRVEAREEAADAIVYHARAIHLRGNP